MKWFIEYFGSIAGMVVSGFVFLVVIGNAARGYGMNWIALTVSVLIMIASAWLNVSVTE